VRLLPLFQQQDIAHAVGKGCSQHVGYDISFIEASEGNVIQLYIFDTNTIGYGYYNNDEKDHLKLFEFPGLRRKI
jgi:hypothetical protein